MIDIWKLTVFLTIMLVYPTDLRKNAPLDVAELTIL